jgi:hypothetical protein
MQRSSSRSDQWGLLRTTAIEKTTTMPRIPVGPSQPIRDWARPAIVRTANSSSRPATTNTASRANGASRRGATPRNANPNSDGCAAFQPAASAKPAATKARATIPTPTIIVRPFDRGIEEAGQDYTAVIGTLQPSGSCGVRGLNRFRVAGVAAILIAGLCAGCGATKRPTSTSSASTGLSGLPQSVAPTATPATQFPVEFGPAPPQLLRQCKQTARVVGYPVPCPTVVPRGLRPTVAPDVGGAQCKFEIVGLPCGSQGRRSPWHGWVIGSSEVDDIRFTVTPEHLVITATPRPLGNYAHVVNGPPWSQSEGRVP